MKTAIVVQARMTSTRLPGKVLMDLAGHPMLAQQLRRLKRCGTADEIVVATTTNQTDDPIVALASAEGVRWYRGSDQDVLSRYLGAAMESRAEAVIRVTADCPIIDPLEIDRVVRELLRASSEADYAANIITRTFPRGLDTEAMFLDTLARVDRMARSRRAREHVTTFIYEERPDLFRIVSVTDERDNSDLRWTVDTLEDLSRIRQIYEKLHLSDSEIPYPEIVAAVRSWQD
jgi:spore coat polysaccharide biosynthesis protein SpsF